MDVNGAKKSCRVCLDWKTTIALQSSRSVCIFHAPAGCLQHICNVLEYSCLFFFSFFFFLEIYKHHTGQQMQIIPEPPWLLGWVTAVLFLLSSCELMEATATPLTTCVLLLWCRHLFCEPSSRMWLMQMLFPPPLFSYTLVCCKQLCFFPVFGCNSRLQGNNRNVPVITQHIPTKIPGGIKLEQYMQIPKC